ncbi:MAG: AI-2E family transporter [Gemmatimonadota bacterium]|nr:AI-2E family transporter [Gemmatimonadota bacterium]
MRPFTAGRFRFAPALAAVVITVLLLRLFAETAELFLLLFISILISLYLGAVTDQLIKWTKMPRGAAFAIALIGTLAVLAGIVYLIVPPVIAQTQQLLKVLPNYIATWQAGIERTVTRIPALKQVWEQQGQNRVLVGLYDQVSGYVSNLLPKVLSLMGVLISVFSVLIMAIYLSLQPGLYRELLIAYFPPLHRDLVRNVLTDLARTLRAYIVGQLVSMLFLGTVTAIGLLLLGVPYWLTFGVFTGIVSIVPFFGTLFSTLIPAMFVLGGENGPDRALFVVLLGVGVHLLEGNFVTPKVMQRQVHVPPVVSIMGVLIIGKILGPLGLVVALPLLAVVLVVTRRILITRIYEGGGFRKTVRDHAFSVRVPVPDGNFLVPEATPPDVLVLSEAAERQRVA